jgi:hypothetical protein
VAEEGSGSALPTDGYIDNSSGEFDASAYFPSPGYNIATEPGQALTAEQFASEQAAARSWLATIGSPVVLNAAQVAAGLASGIIKAVTPGEHSNCPGGYVFQNGDCAHVQQATSKPAAGQLVPGISNNTLLIIGIGFAFLMILSQSGGRRR